MASTLEKTRLRGEGSWEAPSPTSLLTQPWRLSFLWDPFWWSSR